MIEVYESVDLTPHIEIHLPIKMTLPLVNPPLAVGGRLKNVAPRIIERPWCEWHSGILPLITFIEKSTHDRHRKRRIELELILQPKAELPDSQRPDLVPKP
jgi:hypothetical protein